MCGRSTAHMVSCGLQVRLAKEKKVQAEKQKREQERLAKVWPSAPTSSMLLQNLLCKVSVSSLLNHDRELQRTVFHGSMVYR